MILYDPSSGSPDPTLSVSYTLSEQVPEGGTGTLQMDPLFVDASGTSDYAAEPVPNGGRLNLGNYGNSGEASKSN